MILPHLEKLKLPSIAMLQTSLGDNFVFKAYGFVKIQPVADMFRPWNISYPLRTPSLLELDSNYNANYLINSTKYKLSRNF